MSQKIVLGHSWLRSEETWTPFLVRAARKIYTRRKYELKITQQQLVERYNRAVNDVPQGLRAFLTRESYGRFEKLRKPDATKPFWQPGVHHLDVMARAVEKDLSWLIGIGSPVPTLEPLIDPDDHKRFLAKLSSVLRHDSELIGWATYLPCSLETYDFMCGHHDFIFSEVPIEPNQRTALREAFNAIGKERMERFREVGPKRSSTFVHLIGYRDIIEIAKGTGPFRNCTRSSRLECLQNLIGYLLDPGWKVSLTLLNNDEPNPLFYSLDSLVTIDESLSFWRHRNGELHSTTEVDVVRKHHSILRALRQSTNFKNDRETVKELQQIILANFAQ